jgi:uncharacterized protein
MIRRIRIHAGKLSVIAELNDSKTAAAIQAALPVEALASTWGDEVYFPIPVELPLDESAVEIVELGDLGYWPTGRAFCIFFGPTPASRGEEIRPASAVNLVGKVCGNTGVFRAIQAGDLVRLENDS